MALPKLIASDLDGTLLTEGTRVLSGRALALITEYIDRGGVFVAASGRQYENIRDIFAPIRDRIGYVCYSGGLCLYRGETVYERCIDPALCAQMIADIEGTPDCEAMLSVRGTELISPKEPEMYRYLTEDVGAYTTVTDRLCTYRDGIYKISLFNKDGHIDRAYWKEKYGRRCEALDSGSVWMDFLPTGVNKGTALLALAKQLGIDPEECVAFGDNENDMGMLQAVGRPIAMRHGDERLRRIAKETADAVETKLESLLQVSY